MHENMEEEEERKVVNEFCHLLEKSKQLFNGLRDMPQYGHKQWQAYFGRTFDIFTKLWKFQQQHRPVLDRSAGPQLFGNSFNVDILQKIWFKAMANWRNCVQNRTTVLSLLVSTSLLAKNVTK